MRIVHFVVGRCNPDSANGVDRSVFNLSKHQAALGHDVAVFSFTPKPPLTIPGVAVRCFAPSRIPFVLPRQLLGAVIEFRPDVVHLHSVYVPANASLARWLASRRLPYVVTPNGGLHPAVMRRRRLPKTLYRISVELPFLNGAGFVHAVADAEGEAIRNYGVCVPIVTAPNGLDPAEVPSSCDPEFLSRRFPIVRGKRVLLFLGRLAPFHKGLDLLLQGFNRSQLTDAVLVLVGPDWRGSRAALEHLSRELGVQDRVVFAGPAYGCDKFALLAGADIFVHLSRWEGVSLAVLEAAAMGKPCLLTPAADPCGMVARHCAGFVVPPEVNPIADGLRRALESPPDVLRAMGSRARRMIEEEFDWDKIAEKVVTAYEDHAGPHSGRRA